MMNVIIPVEENKLRALQQIAEREGTTPEAIFLQLIDEYLEAQQTQGVDYPDWIKPGLFFGGTEVTGENSEDILHTEWEPD
jgi:hypothetical protein